MVTYHRSVNNSSSGTTNDTDRQIGLDALTADLIADELLALVEGIL